MVVIFWIQAGEKRDCGGIDMVFVPLYAPALAKQVVEVKNIDQLAAKWEQFWTANKSVCPVPSPRIEAGQGRKIARFDDGKRHCYAMVNMGR